MDTGLFEDVPPSQTSSENAWLVADSVVLQKPKRWRTYQLITRLKPLLLPMLELIPLDTQDSKEIWPHLHMYGLESYSSRDNEYYGDGQIHLRPQMFYQPTWPRLSTQIRLWHEFCWCQKRTCKGMGRNEPEQNPKVPPDQELWLDRFQYECSSCITHGSIVGMTDQNLAVSSRGSPRRSQRSTWWRLTPHLLHGSGEHCEQSSKQCRSFQPRHPRTDHANAAAYPEIKGCCHDQESCNYKIPLLELAMEASSIPCKPVLAEMEMRVSPNTPNQAQVAISSMQSSSRRHSASERECSQKSVGTGTASNDGHIRKVQICMATKEAGEWWQSAWSANPQVGAISWGTGMLSEQGEHPH